VNGRDGSRGSSGNRAPNRQRGIFQVQLPPRVTFDEAFDFEKSNEELKTAMEKLKLKEEEGEKREGEEAGENKEEKKEDPVTYYDKDKFFDNISCEALERARGGRQPRQDWRAERKLNAETFGLVWKPNQNYLRNGPRNYNRPRMDRGGYRGGNNPIRYNNRYNNRS
jgi:protein LSM14